MRFNKLKSREIPSVLNHGRKIKTKHFLVFYRSGDQGLQQVISPVRIYKTATSRNKVKRILRILVSSIQDLFPPGQIIVMANKGILNLWNQDPATAKQKLTIELKRAIDIISSPTPRVK